MSDLPQGCPSCYYESDGAHCEQACEHPACSPCGRERWARENPYEALKELADELSEMAQRAEEAQYDDWRQYVAEEQAAHAMVEECERLEQTEGYAAAEEEAARWLGYRAALTPPQGEQP